MLLLIAQCDDEIKSAIKKFDMALLMGGPRYQVAITSFVSLLHKKHSNLTTSGNIPIRKDKEVTKEEGKGKEKEKEKKESKKRKRDELPEPVLDPNRGVPRIRLPALLEFGQYVSILIIIQFLHFISYIFAYRKIMTEGKPVIITGLMDNWPAMGGTHDWRSLDYLKAHLTGLHLDKCNDLYNLVIFLIVSGGSSDGPSRGR